MSCISQNAFPCFQHFIAVFPVIKRIRSQALHFGSTVVVLLLAAVGMGHLEWITGNAKSTYIHPLKEQVSIFSSCGIHVLSVGILRLNK